MDVNEMNELFLKRPHVYTLGAGASLAAFPNGEIDCGCIKCGNRLTDSKLLYPIKTKNYTNDIFISNEWNALKNYLKNTYILSIFRYSAPKSDVEAKQLMQEAWGKAEERNLEQIEIIDIQEEDNLLNTWESFIHTHHYDIYDNFYKSWSATYPRQSSESLWDETMEVKFLEDNSIPKNANFSELERFFKFDQ